jgi:4-hydroxy-tetrahydrodipicolinate reductase
VGRVPLLIYGATGRLGRAVRACLPEFPDVELRACVARSASDSVPPGAEASEEAAERWLTPEALAAPSARESLPEDLVVLDVSVVPGPARLAEILTGWPRALVAAATGLDAATEEKLEALASKAAVLRAPNLSLGIAVAERFLRTLPLAAREAWTADVVEHHHAAKRDAPSGTALALRRALGAAGPAARPGGEVAIHSIRAGTVPGTHRIVFSGEGETLEIVHTVYDRGVFARGALRAVRFLHGRPAGRYTTAHLTGGT